MGIVTIYDAKLMTNRRLKVIGVLPTLFDARTSHSRTVLERISTDSGIAVLSPPSRSPYGLPKLLPLAAPFWPRPIHRRGAIAYCEVAHSLLTSLTADAVCRAG